MSIRTPNYVLTEAINVSSSDGRQAKELPAGSFVRPIQPCYVPKHITEGAVGRYFNEKNEVYVYTRYGIVTIPKSYLRQV